MPLTLVTPPVNPILSLEDARAQLRVEACGSPPEHPDDALITALIGMVASELDGVDGWLGRALIDQTWLLTLDQFPGAARRHFVFDRCAVQDRLYLPLTSPQYSGASPAPAPVIELSYVDCNGVTTVLTEGDDYRVVTDSDPMFLEPAYGTAWPTTRDTAGAVRLTYEAGYGPDAADIPGTIINYARLRLGQLYEFRELVIAGTIVAEIPFIRDSLENIRLRGFK